MKNRYLRAAVWMLTVLMVLGCLPLLAAAEGTLTEVSGGTSAGAMLAAEGDTYKITYSSNTGWLGSGTYYQEDAVGGQGLVFPELPAGWERTGYVFAGWSQRFYFDDSSVTNGTYQPGTQWCTSAGVPGVVTGNMTFYARWINATASSTDAAFYIRLDGQIPFEPVKENPSADQYQYIANGRLRTAESVTNNTATVNANLASQPSLATIYAQMTADGVDHEYGTLMQYTNDDGETEYNFTVRWYVIKNVGSSSGWFGSKEWQVHGILVPENYFTVAYDANGGTNPPDTHLAKANTMAEIEFDTIPAKQGYRFLGWSRDKNASEPEYPYATFIAGNTQTITVDQDITLYAVWEANTDTPYTVERYYEQADGTYPTTASVSITDYGKTDTEVAIEGIPEVDGYTYDTTANNVTSGTITSDGSLVLKLYYKRNLGTLKLSKIVSNDTGDTTTEFTFNVFTIRDNDIGRTIQIDGNNHVLGSTLTVPVKANSTVTLRNFPAGFYSVEEDGVTDGIVTVNGVNYSSAEHVKNVTVTLNETTTATITNTIAETTFTVSKQVTGNFGDINREFTFEATVESGGKAVAIKEGDGYTVSGEKITFSLKHGQSVTLQGVPTGATVTVTETNYSPYTSDYYSNGGYVATDNGSVTVYGVGDGAGVSFRNTYNVKIDTGVDLDTIPYVVMLLSIFGAGALWLIGRRRRTQN